MGLVTITKEQVSSMQDCVPYVIVIAAKGDRGLIEDSMQGYNEYNIMWIYDNYAEASFELQTHLSDYGITEDRVTYAILEDA